MKENITFWISVVAFALSLYNFLESLINSTKKVSIKIYEINQYKISEKKFVYQALINISNKSNLPVAVTHLVANNISCKILPSFISENKRTIGKEIISREVVKTIPFPINLSQLQSTTGYIEFISDHAIDKNKIVFDVYTNRGKLSSVLPFYIDCK